MSDLGEGMFVMGGAGEQTRNSDVHYSFRQNSDFSISRVLMSPMQV